MPRPTLKHQVNFRLTPPALDALAGIAAYYGVSQTAAVEITLRAQWRCIQGESVATAEPAAIAREQNSSATDSMLD